MPYVIYNKWTDDLPDCVKKECVIKIPNIWREEYVYVKYIIDNRDNLDDYTVFAQWRPFDAEPIFLEKIRTAEFFPLSRLIKTDDINWWPYHPWIPIGEVCNKILDYNPTHFTYNISAQFVVSRERIQYREKDRWVKLLSLIEEHPEYMPRVMERLRHLVFNNKIVWKLW